jgi:hypothetical protein
MPARPRSAIRSIAGSQIHPGVTFVEILTDDTVFQDHVVPIDEGWHHAVRVELQIFRIKLVFLAQFEEHRLERQFLLALRQVALGQALLGTTLVLEQGHMSHHFVAELHSCF